MGDDITDLSSEILNRFVAWMNGEGYPVKDHPEIGKLILEYASPLNGYFDGLSTRLSIAIFAWNISLIPEEERFAFIDSFLEPLVAGDPEGKQAFSDIIFTMIERKTEMFPEDDMLILPEDEVPSKKNDSTESKDE